MVKKKSNIQNVIIIILCILLLISIGFGVTYSYYNGRTNLVKGSITTANLSISLEGFNNGQTTEFSITSPYDEKFLVPGNSLNNVELRLLNKCNQDVYMVVVYALSAVREADNVDVTSQLTNMPAIAFDSDSIDNHWESISYKCSNIDATYTCLVGLNEFKRESSYGQYINVLKPNSISIPREWNNVLQGCSVTISVIAYAIQAKNLGPEYNMPILEAQNKIQMSTGVELSQARQEKAQAIAKATLEICEIDVTK